MSTPPIIIITGPTASGKSSLAEQLALEYNGQIINADAAQMYTPLSIGTAKPDWRASPIPQHLFDIVNTPIDTSVIAYRAMVIEKVNELTVLHKPIIIVGGSLFYITSLFYPPLPLIRSDQQNKNAQDDSLDGTLAPWEQLNQIDADRAQELHPNDTYRIQRALAIWHTTGRKPSLHKPVYNPPFHATVMCINPDRAVLHQRINERTIAMIHDGGWIRETESVTGSDWEKFITMKGFIGYPELFKWIHAGKDEATLSEVITVIQQKTRAYAKRQITFWRRLAHMLQNETSPLPIIELSSHECSLEIKNKFFPGK